MSAEKRMFTDEQLSRILSEHEAGFLCQFGGDYEWKGGCGGVYPTGCALQAALNEPTLPYIPGIYTMIYHFDKRYERDMTTDALLALLERPNEAL